MTKKPYRETAPANPSPQESIEQRRVISENPLNGNLRTDSAPGRSGG